jgi:hypothetical protein
MCRDRLVCEKLILEIVAKCFVFTAVLIVAPVVLVNIIRWPRCHSVTFGVRKWDITNTIQDGFSVAVNNGPAQN